MVHDFSGSWNADLLKSKFVGPIPCSLRINIDHCETELKEELIVTNQDGTENRVAFVCRMDGDGEESTCLMNGNALRGRARWVGLELFIETWIKSGDRETYFCDCWSLSAGGQDLIMEHRNDALAGQRIVLVRALAR